MFRRGASAADPDVLGLRRALRDPILPLLVGAVTFLGVLAVGGEVGARALARHWRAGAESVLTVQVPRPADAAPKTLGDPSAAPTRLDLAVAMLAADPAIASARAVPDAELAALLRPWFRGVDPPPGLELPGVIDARLATAPLPDATLAALGARLAAAVPQAEIEGHAAWTGQLAALGASLRACALLALAVIGAVAVMVVVVVTRNTLIARREAIGILHGLGATDGYIAARFARRATLQAAAGSVLGAAASVPVLLAMASLAAPFARPEAPPAVAREAVAASGGKLLAARTTAGQVPAALWVTLPALPFAATLIGFATAQATVRSWLRRLP